VGLKTSATLGRLFLTALNNTLMFAAGSTVPVSIASCRRRRCHQASAVATSSRQPLLPAVLRRVVIAVVWRMLPHQMAS
jgi:hypothetical protein